MSKWDVLFRPDARTRRDQWVRRGEGAGILRGWHLAIFIVSFGACLFFVLSMYGFVPGSSQVPLTALSGTGAIQCLHNQGIASMWTWCMSLGLPIGAPRMTGLPQVYAGWLLTYVPGIDAWVAHQLSNAAFVAVAFIASYALLRRWGAPRWIAVVTTTSYLTAINLLFLNGFEYTFLGYILLPAYVYAALKILDSMSAGRWMRAVLASFGLSLFMVFTEGYSFFGAGLVIACLVVAWAFRTVRGSRLRQALAGVAMWAAGAGGASLLYVIWLPNGAFETSVSLETFGLYGVDVTSLFSPGETMLYPKLLGIELPPIELWGVAGVIEANYLGYASLALALGFLVVSGVRARRPRTEQTETASNVTGSSAGELFAVAVAGVIALVLSFGPVLKVGQTVPGLAAAVFELPTAWAYANVPGMTEMRAVNRWLVVTRWCLIMLAAGGLTMLWRDWRGASAPRAVAVVLAALTVVEIAPDISREQSLRALSVERVVYLRYGIVAEAHDLIKEGETVLMLPSGNDFLANYLVPMVGARSYNVGVDKNYALAVSRWPKPVLAARDAYGPKAANALCHALASDVDAIVLPYMSPYYGPLLFGNDPSSEAKRKGVALQLAKDPRFHAEVGKWLTVLRGADKNCSRS